MSEKTVALITGASSGIGREYALQLAPRCDEMILVARREKPLEQLAEELKTWGVKSHVMTLDLIQPLSRGYVVEAIRQKGPVTYLINNAGFGTLGPFDQQQLESQQQMVDLHISTSMALSRAVIPYMKEQGRGAIINLSSFVGLVPCENVAVYSATKAFLNSFSEALSKELQGSGIKVQSCCPGYTRSEFHQQQGFSGFDSAAVPEEMWMEAKDVVRQSLSALECDQVVFVAGEHNRKIIREALIKFADQL